LLLTAHWIWAYWKNSIFRLFSLPFSGASNSKYHLLHLCKISLFVNITVEWVRLFRMLEVSGSSLGPKTCFPFCGYSRFSWIPQGKQCLKLVHNPCLPHSFLFFLYFSNHFTIRHYTV
jgi:hypothetical protein